MKAEDGGTKNKPALVDHKYVTHPTYTGKGCALCGRGESEHVAPWEKAS